MAEMRNIHRILAGKPKGKKLFGRSRHRLHNVIKINLK
jgi:hypothetical protein